MSEFELNFWRIGAIALEERKQETDKAILEFLKNPIGRNKEKLADLIRTDLQGESK